MSNGSLHVTMTILVVHLFKLQSYAPRLPFFIALHLSQIRHGAIHGEDQDSTYQNHLLDNQSNRSRDPESFENRMVF